MQNQQEAIAILNREVEVYARLNHENLVRLLHFKQNATEIFADGTEIVVSYVALELASGGEIFDYVARHYFSPEISRYFFKQMLDGIHHMHSKGIAHRDLKLENILLDENFNIKITDYGFVGPIEGRDGSGFLHTRLGTRGC